jgi:multidrug efflux pump subunit AcrA (membrane-fusion protein)
MTVRSGMAGRPAARGWLIISVAGAVVLLGAFALRRPAGAAVETARAVRKDILVPVLSDGTLEPPPGGELRCAETALVAAVLVKEGDRVGKGQELVRLENPELARAAREARSGALALGEDRASAVSELDQSRGESGHLREVVAADRRLLAQSAVSRATLEADELALARSEARALAAQARLDSLGRGAGAAGRSRIAIADASARDLERRLSALLVRAPFQGVVYGLPPRTGETIAAGKAVASVTDPEHLRVRVRVDEPDLPRILVGQRLVVRFDGLPERRWEGKILAVSSGVRESGGREVGEAIGEISDPKLSLPPNASVNVEIVVGSKAGVLAVPRAALFRDETRRFVYRLDGGRARRQDISTGLVGLDDVEVASGLSEADAVILPGGVPLSDGLAVTVRPSR